MSEPWRDLTPDEAVPANEKNGRKYFGYGHSQCAELIDQKKLPTPFAMYDGGRTKFWLGRQIIDHHRARQAAGGDA